MFVGRTHFEPLGCTIRHPLVSVYSQIVYSQIVYSQIFFIIILK